MYVAGSLLTLQKDSLKQCQHQIISQAVHAWCKSKCENVYSPERHVAFDKLIQSGISVSVVVAHYEKADENSDQDLEVESMVSNRPRWTRVLTAVIKGKESVMVLVICE